MKQYFFIKKKNKTGQKIGLTIHMLENNINYILYLEISPNSLIKLLD